LAFQFPGDGLDARDVVGAAPVIVVSEVVARTLFGTVEVVGRRVVYKRAPWAGLPAPKDEPAMIVGVVADTDTGSVGRRDHGSVYLPLDQHYEGLWSAKTSRCPSEDAVRGEFPIVSGMDARMN
jgi:hypothetical protein